MIWCALVIAIKGSYSVLGLGLILAGGLLALLSYFVLVSVSLTATGVSAIIIGGVSLALASGEPRIPPEASAILLESGLDNISEIIEEIGLESKAIYLPSSLTSGKPQAFIPLHSNPHTPKFEKPLPKRLIVKFGPNPDDMGILLTTPGSAITGIIASKPDPSAGDLEAALESVLVGTINLVDSARVNMDNEKIIVEVSNPRLEYKKTVVYERLGSPIASMVASIAAEVLDKPVSIVREESEKGKCVIELKVVG